MPWSGREILPFPFCVRAVWEPSIFRLSEMTFGVNLRQARTSAFDFQNVDLSGKGVGMVGRVTSVFLYVKDVRRSLEFYNEVVGADIVQLHAEHEGAPYTLAILRIGQFTLMLHPQEPHEEEFADTRMGVGIHLQLQVPDVDQFFQHCMDQGALLAISGEPTDQSWGWREFALRDPDGFVWSIYQDKSNGQWTA